MKSPAVVDWRKLRHVNKTHQLRLTASSPSLDGVVKDLLPRLRAAYEYVALVR